MKITKLQRSGRHLNFLINPNKVWKELKGKEGRKEDRRKGGREAESEREKEEKSTWNFYIPLKKGNCVTIHLGKIKGTKLRRKIKGRVISGPRVAKLIFLFWINHWIWLFPKYLGGLQLVTLNVLNSPGEQRGKLPTFYEKLQPIDILWLILKSPLKKSMSGKSNI